MLLASTPRCHTGVKLVKFIEQIVDPKNGPELQIFSKLVFAIQVRGYPVAVCIPFTLHYVGHPVAATICVQAPADYIVRPTGKLPVGIIDQS
jgi:hypothetical protein